MNKKQQKYLIIAAAILAAIGLALGGWYVSKRKVSGDNELPNSGGGGLLPPVGGGDEEPPDENGGGGNGNGNGGGGNGNGNGNGNGGGEEQPLPNYNPQISINPTSGVKSDNPTFTVSGYGFPPSHYIEAMVNDTHKVSNSSWKTDANGNISLTEKWLTWGSNGSGVLGVNSLYLQSRAGTHVPVTSSVSNTVTFIILEAPTSYAPNIAASPLLQDLADNTNPTWSVTGTGFPKSEYLYGYINGVKWTAGSINLRTSANGTINLVSQTFNAVDVGENSIVMHTCATNAYSNPTSTSNTVKVTLIDSRPVDPEKPQAPIPRNGTGYDVKGSLTFPNVSIVGAIDTPPKQIAKAEDNLITYTPSYGDRVTNIQMLWNVRRHLYKRLLTRAVGTGSTFDDTLEAYDRLNPQVNSTTKPRGANSGYKDWFDNAIIVGTPFVTHMWNGHDLGVARWYVILPDESPYAWVPQWDLPSSLVTMNTIKAAEFDDYGV